MNRSESRLWSAVVIQAIADALAPDRVALETRAHRDALDWFRTGSPYFRRVCALADVDADCVRDRVMAAIDGDVDDRRAVIAPLTTGERGKRKVLGSIEPPRETVRRGFLEPLSDAHVRRIVELYRQGLTYTKIAACLGLSDSTVMKRIRTLREAGHDLPKRRRAA